MAREQARRRREAASKAVEQLRVRNREESARLAQPGHPRRRGEPQWPRHEPEQRELQSPPPRSTPASHYHHAASPRPSDDDWSQESWLH